MNRLRLDPDMLPRRLPWQAGVLIYLLLEKFQVPGWIVGAVGITWGYYFAAVLIGWAREKYVTPTWWLELNEKE